MSSASGLHDDTNCRQHDLLSAGHHGNTTNRHLGLDPIALLGVVPMIHRRIVTISLTLGESTGGRQTRASGNKKITRSGQFLIGSWYFPSPCSPPT